ncbi:hypothetical protein C2G38_2059813 [Gigaspora rosea]|uniref:MARVEL domain-containing protein n=1 Tax=Gigaspora rosea TaxID=44941 RepID=A0A397W0K3_9GLOM|nr:hypothetical protein C2G38_2059813 [Gigaspora rosea]
MEILFRCLLFLYLLVLFFSPWIELTKIILLYKYREENVITSFNWIIEYIYFATTLCAFVLVFAIILLNHHKNFNRNIILNSVLFLLGLLWIGISITYECLTIHESSSIPEFSCPSSYNYQPSSLLTFCYIRLTNLSCMWSLSGISILIGIIGIINYVKIGLSIPSRVVIKDTGSEILETTDVIDNDFTNFTSSGVSGEFIAYVENRSDNNLNNNINENNIVNRSFENIARENNFNDEARDDIV